MNLTMKALAIALCLTAFVHSLPGGFTGTAWAIDSEDEADDDDDADDGGEGKQKASAADEKVDARLIQSGDMAQPRRTGARKYADRRPVQRDDFGPATVDGEPASIAPAPVARESQSAPPPRTDHSAQLRATDARFRGAAAILREYLNGRKDPTDLRETLAAIDGIPSRQAAGINGVPGELSADIIAYTADMVSLGAIRGLQSSMAHLAREDAFAMGLPALHERIVEAIDKARQMRSTLGNGADSDQAALVLDAFIGRASEHRQALRDAMTATIQTFPNSLAGGHDVEVADLDALAFGSGRNASTYRLNFDFDTGTGSEPDASGFDALFKAEPERGEKLEAGDDLEALGVDISGGTPMRLSLRAKASALVAEVLDEGDLVVATELATVNGDRFGIVMELAEGRAPVNKDWIAADDEDRPTQSLIQRHGTISDEIEALQALVNDTTAARDALSLARQVEGRSRTVTFSPAATIDLDQANRLVEDAKATLNDRRFDLANIEQNLRRVDIDDGNDGTTQVWQVATAARWLSDQDLARPDLRRALAVAELLDHLCGQVDRHIGNLNVDLGSGNEPVSVKLFDNDQAFAPEPYYPDAALTAGTRPRAPSLANLPKVVDLAFRDKLLKLTPAALKEQLAGYLSARELENLGNRLERLKAYVRGLPTVSIDGAGADMSWGAPAAQLFHNADPDNRDRTKRSYYGEILHSPFVAPATDS